MAVDGVLLPEIVFGVPSCRVGLYPKEMKFQGRLVWVATFDIAVLIGGDKKFTIPALVRGHASGWACDARLSVCLLYAFDPSHMLHRCHLLSKSASGWTHQRPLFSPLTL